MNRPVGSSSAVSSVLFTPHGGNSLVESRSGAYIYHGDATHFHEWEFRTRLRIAGRTGNGYLDAVAKVVEGLRGDAFIAAQEVGLTQLWQAPPAEPSDLPSFDVGTNGIELLISKMRTMVFPYSNHEAKELFRQYTKPGGALSRQRGESMCQYVARRRRCWALLQELDKELVLSEGHRADLLLDLSGLDRNERVMVCDGAVDRKTDHSHFLAGCTCLHIASSCLFMPRSPNAFQPKTYHWTVN